MMVHDDDDGGYDAFFVGDLQDAYKCAVCHLALRKPVQVIECGHRFCECCFIKMKNDSEIRHVEFCCPFDRLAIYPSEVFRDKGIERTVLDLPVKCSNFQRGCNWVQELMHLQHHLQNNCPHEMIKCSNTECSKLIERCELSQHEKQCPVLQQTILHSMQNLEATVQQLSERIFAYESQLTMKDGRLAMYENVLSENNERIALLEKKLVDNGKIYGLEKAEFFDKIKQLEDRLRKVECFSEEKFMDKHHPMVTGKLKAASSEPAINIDDSDSRQTPKQSNSHHHNNKIDFSRIPPIPQIPKLMDVICGDDVGIDNFRPNVNTSTRRHGKLSAASSEPAINKDYSDSTQTSKQSNSHHRNNEIDFCRIPSIPQISKLTNVNLRDAGGIDNYRRNDVETSTKRHQKSSELQDFQIRYDRDFLLKFQTAPVCSSKPEGLHDVDIVLNERHAPTTPLNQNERLNIISSIRRRNNSRNNNESRLQGFNPRFVHETDEARLLRLYTEMEDG